MMGPMTERTACGGAVALVAAAIALVLAAMLPQAARADLTQLDDGTYEVPVTMTGGTGKASISSPARVSVSGGSATATIVWSSSSYDKMTVGGKDYAPTTTEGGSTFEIPVTDDEMKVKAETTAMSTPHTISYTISFGMGSAQAVSEGASAAIVVGAAVVVLLVVGIVLGVAMNRRKARR